ncbi:MAG: hypothetical protein RRY29_04575 [Desulfovibrionaceae bacterium]
MEVCIAYMREQAVMLSIKDNIIFIDDEAQPIKGISQKDLQDFSDTVNAIPYSPGPGYQALVNAKRTAFLIKLLGHAVGEECMDKLSHILDSVHFDVLEFLGENPDN